MCALGLQLFDVETNILGHHLALWNDKCFVACASSCLQHAIFKGRREQQAVGDIIAVKTCTIDGEDTDILRADYVLRAVVIPAGKHHVEFRFDPQSLHTTEAVANTSLVALILLFLALVGYEIYRRRRSAAQ